MPLWEHLSSREIAAIVDGGMDMAVLPVGATEQHGPHLPTGTDTLSAMTIAREAVARAKVLLLPALPYGCSLGHTDRWAGTVSLSPVTLTTMIVEISRWALRSGIRKLLYFSGHATNSASLGSAILQMRHEAPEARFAQLGIWEISPRVRALYTRDGNDVHANQGETSLLLHYAPDMVHMEYAFDVEDITPGRVWSYDMSRTTPTGVVGRPTQASTQDGAQMAAIMVEDLTAVLRAGLWEDWPAPLPSP